MDVPVRRVLAPSVGTDVAEPSLDAIVGIEILEVFEFRIAHQGRGVDEGVFCLFGPEGAAGDADGSVGAVVFGVTASVIGFEL